MFPSAAFWWNILAVPFTWRKSNNKKWNEQNKEKKNEIKHTIRSSQYRRSSYGDDDDGALVADSKLNYS